MKYRNLIENKAFIFYFIPWLMITLVNFLTIPIQSKIYPSNGNLYETLYAGENVVIALVAVICGFIADKWGRKRLSIIGFVMLGIGYAVIGLSYSNIHDPSDLTGMFYPSIFFAISDGIAWGIFYVLFLFTLWGDLGQGKISDKIYYLGALPYISSYFLRELFAPSLSQLNPLTIFTFASVFLFLAVLPLLYASETLPEKVMKDRDLKSYIEKAKKKADKESKREQRKEETQDAIPDENYEEATKLAEKYY